MGEADGSLGFVGYLTGVNVEFLESLWRAGVMPVSSCLGLGADGEIYNINADHMAAACAEYVHAERLIYLTDVAGVLDGDESAAGDLLRGDRGAHPAEQGDRRHGAEAGSVQARALGWRAAGVHRRRNEPGRAAGGGERRRVSAARE